MTILFDSSRRVKSNARPYTSVGRPGGRKGNARTRRPFAAGINVRPERRTPYTAADLAWAASNLNASSQDFDAMAEESAMQARYEAGFLPC